MDRINCVVHDGKDKRQQGLCNPVSFKEEVPHGPGEEAYGNEKHGIDSETPLRKQVFCKAGKPVCDGRLLDVRQRRIKNHEGEEQIGRCLADIDPLDHGRLEDRDEREYTKEGEPSHRNSPNSGVKDLTRMYRKFKPVVQPFRFRLVPTLCVPIQ